MDSAKQFVSKNLLTLIVYIIVIAMAYANLSSRVLAVEKGHGEIDNKLNDLITVTTQLALLEQEDKNIEGKITEINNDIKEIKNTQAQILRELK